MKQFAQKTLKLWKQDDSFTDEDRLIDDYITFESGSADKDKNMTVSRAEKDTVSKINRVQNKENPSLTEHHLKSPHSLPIEESKSQIVQNMKKMPNNLG